MYYMIDLENVGEYGFNGAEYLDRSDMVVIFYSGGKYLLPKSILNTLRDRKCRVELINVIKGENKKNAADFYIASWLGAHLKDRDRVIMVTNDAGFDNIANYWRLSSPLKISIMRCSNIAQGICSMEKNVGKSSLALDNIQLVNLNDYQKALDEKTVRLKAELRNKLREKTDESFDRAKKVVSASNNNFQAYTSILHTFGWDKGQKVWDVIGTQTSMMIA